MTSYIIQGKNQLKGSYRVEAYDELGYGVWEEEALKEALSQQAVMQKDNKLKLLPVMDYSEASICSFSMLFAVLTPEKKEGSYHYYYDVSADSWEKGRPVGQSSCLKICCYARQQEIWTSEYLRTLEVLHQLAGKLGKGLVVLGHCQDQMQAAPQNALAEAIRRGYSQKYGSLIWWQQSPGEKYHEEEGTLRNWQQALKRISRWQSFKRQAPDSDGFYEKLPDEAWTYAGPYFDEAIEEAFQKVRRIAIGLGRSLLYGRTGEMRALQNVLPDAARIAWMQKKGRVHEGKMSSLPESKFKGRDIYIGLITEAQGDYLEPALRKQDGSLRTVCLWEQQEGDRGLYKRGQELLQQPIQESRPKEEEVTRCLTLMGGENRGAASETEWILAKLQKAGPAFQEVYGEAAGSVQAGDVMVGAEKLAKLARVNHKPLILVLPYGQSFLHNEPYQAWLKNFAGLPGHMIILPAGDNGSQRQLCAWTQLDQPRLSCSIKATQEQAMLTVYLLAKHAPLFSVKLKNEQQESWELTVPQQIQSGDIRLETSGILFNEVQDEEEILWQIKPLKKGTWQIEVLLQPQAEGELHIRLEGLSPEQVYLTPSTSFGTQEVPQGQGILWAGCYREKDHVAYGFSARKKQGEKEEAFGVMVSDRLLKGGVMSSTLEAACIAAGIMTCFYEKMQQQEQRRYLEAPYVQRQFQQALSPLPENASALFGSKCGLLDAKAVRRLLEGGDRDDHQ